MWPVVPFVVALAALAWFSDAEASAMQADSPERPGKWFSWDELQTTSTGLPNKPTAEDQANLQRLVADVLDPLREIVGLPVRVGSAYRSQAVNEAIGGAEASQHMRGLAADVRIDGASSADVAAIIVYYDLPFDQIVVYEPESGKRHTHVSIAAPGAPPRRDIRVFDGRSYEPISADELLALVAVVKT